MTAEVPDFSCSPGSIVQDNITFQLQGNSPPKEILRLDSEGFHYRGQLIEDAGEAHWLFIEFMRQSNDMRRINQPTPRPPMTDLSPAAQSVLDAFLDTPGEVLMPMWDYGRDLAAALRALAVRINGADPIRQDILDIADELENKHD